jgi:hypothetical protein
MLIRPSRWRAVAGTQLSVHKHYFDDRLIRRADARRMDGVPAKAGIKPGHDRRVFEGRECRS